MKNYSWPDQIADKAIIDEFEKTTTVMFSARPYNYVAYRSIAIGDLGWWLPLMRVLPLLGITPQMLRPVFNPLQIIEEKSEKVLIKRSFPFSLFEKFGIIKKKYEDKKEHQVKEVDLPEIVENYEQLGGFPLTEERFKKLSIILGKSVEVLKEDGGTGEHYPVFNICLS